MDIFPTDRTAQVAAQTFAGSDFEDDLQIASAQQAGVDEIVTRDPNGFATSPIPVITPADLAAARSDDAVGRMGRWQHRQLSRRRSTSSLSPESFTPD